MHNSRSRLLASRWGGQHEAARGVIAGSERVQDLKADSIRNCDDVAVGRTLNYFGALAFVTHLSAVVVSTEQNDQPPGFWTKKEGGGVGYRGGWGRRLTRPCRCKLHAKQKPNSSPCQMRRNGRHSHGHQRRRMERLFLSNTVTDCALAHEDSLVCPYINLDCCGRTQR